MNFNVLTTSNFKREAKRLSKKYPSLQEELIDLIGQLEEKPLLGTSLGKNCYKIRMAISAKGKGKSGGGRVITCVKIVKKTVYLLTLFDKSEQEGISNKELTELLGDIPE